MYLAPALKIAIPFAILDREDLSRVHDDEGPEAEEAEKACEDMRKLRGIKVQAFNDAQRMTAGLALCWAEQYLYGYIDALGKGSDKEEIRVAKKQMAQIRAVRLEHFGYTEREKSDMASVAIPIGGKVRHDALVKLLGNTVVACNSCPTKTNMRAVGDKCPNCSTGTFQSTAATKA
jgi:hypothetical protein